MSLIKALQKIEKGIKKDSEAKLLGYKILIDEEKVVVAQTLKDKHFQIYLNESIGSQYHYEGLMFFLRSRKKGDVVNLFVNNFGGQIHTTVQLINCITDSKAKITGICDSAVYSAAPLVLLSCPNVILKPNSMLMFHDYAGWNIGRGHEQRSNADNMTIHLRAVMETAACPFLSKKEIDNILEGKDTYIHEKEAQRRLAKHLNK